MLSVWTTAFQRIELGQEAVAEFGAGHADEGDLAAEPGGEIGAALAVLAVESLGPGAMEDRAEAADLGPAGAGAVVDHQAGHHLRRAPPQDPRLGFVDREALVPSDVAHPR